MGKYTHQSGNIMLALFAAVGMVGVIGVSSMAIMKGPVRGMQQVTMRTIAENNMIASGKLSLMAAAGAADNGDCDADGKVEPVAWSTTGTGPKPAGGGYLPASIGAALQDPWGNMYGYCGWDHGAAIQTTCATPTLRLKGTAAADGIVLSVISSGPDRIFQTSCGNAPAYVIKVSGSDDVIFSYTYGEAQALSGGLWNLQAGDTGTAEIKKDLEVKNAANAVVFGVDATTDINKPSIKVDYIKALSQPSIEALSPLRLAGTNMRLELLTGNSISSYTAGIGVNDDGVNFTNTSAIRGFNFKNDNGTLLSIGSQGNVGIKEPAPVATLDVHRKDTTYMTALADVATKSVLKIRPHSTDTTALYFGSQVSGAQTLQAANGPGTGVYDIILNPYGGKVGVGMTPATTFHVDGSIGATGFVGAGCETNCSDVASGYAINYADGRIVATTSLNVPKVIGLDAPSAATDAANKAYVDAKVAAGGGTEADPQVGAVTNGKWCRGNGSAVVCDQAAPEGGGLGTTAPTSTTCLASSWMSGIRYCTANQTVTLANPTLSVVAGKIVVVYSISKGRQNCGATYASCTRSWDGSAWSACNCSCSDGGSCD